MPVWQRAHLQRLPRPVGLWPAIFERQAGRYLDPDAGGNSSGVVNVAFDLLQRHGLRLDPQLTLAIKALVQAESIAFTLHPEEGISVMGFEITKELLVVELTADKVVDVVSQQVMLSLREVVQRLPSLQGATVGWLDQYQKGRFAVKVDTSDLAKELHATRSMARMAIIDVLLVGMIIGSEIAASFSSLLGDFLVTSAQTCHGWLHVLYAAGRRHCHRAGVATATRRQPGLRYLVSRKVMTSKAVVTLCERWISLTGPPVRIAERARGSGIYTGPGRASESERE